MSHVVDPSIISLYREIFRNQHIVVVSGFGWRRSDNVNHPGLDIYTYDGANRRVRGRIILDKSRVPQFTVLVAPDGKGGLMYQGTHKFSTDTYTLKILHLSGFVELAKYFVCIEGGDSSYRTKGYSTGQHFHLEVRDRQNRLVIPSDRLLMSNGAITPVKLF